MRCTVGARHAVPLFGEKITNGATCFAGITVEAATESSKHPLPGLAQSPLVIYSKIESGRARRAVPLQRHTILNGNPVRWADDEENSKRISRAENLWGTAWRALRNSIYRTVH